MIYLCGIHGYNLMANKELASKPMEARLFAWNDLGTPTHDSFLPNE